MSKSPILSTFIDDFSRTFFGISRSEAHAQSICVTCKKPATVFHDQLSIKEYSISGLCQECQDNLFPPSK